MTFNSLQFVGLFAVVLLLYYRFGMKGQNRVMLIAGSLFYAVFDWRFLGLLYLSALVDFLVGRAIEDSAEPRRRKLLLGTSLVVQLGILGVFKYFEFFATSLTSLLNKVGLDADPVTLRVILPVGISFYTFQTLAYVITVYRGQMPAERNLWTFATFVAWFPQLVAGPIERPATLLAQINRDRKAPRRELAESALVLILTGLFKKVVIADGVATFVNTVYGRPESYGWVALATATVGFAIQVYGDFSGYSDMARGISRLLGVELRRNFEEPFLSRDMREFWTRWHTSLGWWFTEFVARPLGGAGRNRTRAVINVLIVFTLIGLWHGAAWTYVVWGTLNGVMVSYRRFREAPADRHPMKLRAADIPAIVRTFAFFCGGVVFFRAASIGDALRIFKRIGTMAPGLASPTDAVFIPLAAVMVLVLDLWLRRRRIVAIETTQTPARLGTIANREQAIHESLLHDVPSIPAGVVVGVLLVGIALFSGGVPTPFIYFQF